MFQLLHLNMQDALLSYMDLYQQHNENDLFECELFLKKNHLHNSSSQQK